MTAKTTIAQVKSYEATIMNLEARNKLLSDSNKEMSNENAQLRKRLNDMKENNKKYRDEIKRIKTLLISFAKSIK